jgi:hypothetical protein
MQTAIRRTVTVQAGGTIQVCAPELPVGATAEVIILLDASTPLVDYSDEWSDEDLADITRHCWNNAAASLGEEPDA